MLTTALVALLERKPRVHERLAPVVAFMVLVFIATMFAKLGRLSRRVRSRIRPLQ